VGAANEGGKQFSSILKNTVLSLERELTSSLVHIAFQGLMGLFGGGSSTSSGGIGGILQAALGIGGAALSGTGGGNTVSGVGTGGMLDAIAGDCPG
jgi:hypothetical protein